MSRDRATQRRSLPSAPRLLAFVTACLGGWVVGTRAPALPALVGSVVGLLACYLWMSGWTHRVAKRRAAAREARRWAVWIADLPSDLRALVRGGPCYAAYRHLGDRAPARLRELLASDVLQPVHLATAVEVCADYADTRRDVLGLARLLEHDDEWVRAGVVWGLARFRADPEVRHLMRAVGQTDHSPEVRRAAERVLSWSGSAS